MVCSSTFQLGSSKTPNSTAFMTYPFHAILLNFPGKIRNFSMDNSYILVSFLPAWCSENKLKKERSLEGAETSWESFTTSTECPWKVAYVLLQIHCRAKKNKSTSQDNESSNGTFAWMTVERVFCEKSKMVEWKWVPVLISSWFDISEIRTCQ